MRAQSGMPVELIDPHAPFDADEVRAFFSSRILGQPDAVDAMVELVTVLRAGLNAPGRPMGSLLFLGPTGVGKTQTALTLARYLFGDEERLVRLDMSEYQDAWSAARLVGRWGGEPGDLVQKLSEQPFRVVLLDEIEKGHPSVFDMLLQVLGEGRLTGANGQTVQATHAVFVMTSNLGAAGPASLGFGAAEDASRSRLHFLRAVEAFFRPEFVGRIERLIPFGALGPDTARKLVERTLDESFAREGVTRRGVRVRATAAVVDRLIEVGFDTRYGARPLKQAVERLVTSALAAFLASEPDADELSLVVDLDADGHVYVDIGDD
jgi:ATP-dependent Clp protease ATP-binding subunit ClpC